VKTYIKAPDKKDVKRLSKSSSIDNPLGTLQENGAEGDVLHDLGCGVYDALTTVFGCELPSFTRTVNNGVCVFLHDLFVRGGAGQEGGWGGCEFRGARPCNEDNIFEGCQKDAVLQEICVDGKCQLNPNDCRGSMYCDGDEPVCFTLNMDPAMNFPFPKDPREGTCVDCLPFLAQCRTNAECCGGNCGFLQIAGINGEVCRFPIL